MKITLTEEQKNQKEMNKKRVASICAIDNYNPEVEVELIESSSFRKDGVKMYLLPLKEKKKMFRMLYPHGKIVYEEIYPAFPKDMPFGDRTAAIEGVTKVIVCAKVYMNHTDEDYMFISMNTQSASLLDLEVPHPDTNYANLYALACGKALSRALSDAGIGMQFYDPDDLSLKEEAKLENANVCDSILANCPLEEDIATDTLAETKEIDVPSEKNDTSPIDIKEELEEKSVEQAWFEEFGTTADVPDYSDVLCSLYQFKGKKYSEMNIGELVMLAGVSKPDLEFEANKYYVNNDPAAVNKLKIKLDSPATKPEIKAQLKKVLGE